MKLSRFGEEQMITIFKQVERGLPVQEVIREHRHLQGDIFAVERASTVDWISASPTNRKRRNTASSGRSHKMRVSSDRIAVYAIRKSGEVSPYFDCLERKELK